MQSALGHMRTGPSKSSWTLRRHAPLLALLAATLAVVAALAGTARPPRRAAASGAQPLARSMAACTADRLKAPATLWSGRPVPLLDPRGQRRALLSAGDPARLRRAVSRLLAGKPLRAVSIGGSVTAGHGAMDGSPAAGGASGTDYIQRLYSWIEDAFPGAAHRLRNAAISGSVVSIFAMCATHMVHPDEDLIVVELSV